jgi:hypothetical protein
MLHISYLPNDHNTDIDNESHSSSFIVNVWPALITIKIVTRLMITIVTFIIIT